MSNMTGHIVSICFILLILILSSLLSKRGILSEEASRKFIHIGVSNWWIIAMIFYNDYLNALIVPVIFIIINYLSYKFNIISAMERDEDRNLGTVYYPIALLILVLFTYRVIDSPYIGAIGVLIMGYADGLAAVIGKTFGKRKLYQDKSFIGTFTMFFVSLIVTTIILSIYNPQLILINVFIISSLATLLELFSRKGLDNLTVPILSSIITYLLVTV